MIVITNGEPHINSEFMDDATAKLKVPYKFHGFLKICGPIHLRKHHPATQNNTSETQSITICSFSLNMGFLLSLEQKDNMFKFTRM